MVKVKGATLAGRLSYVRRHHGEDAVERVLAALKDREGAAAIARGPSRTEWYPFTWFIDLIECIDRVCGQGDGALYRPMAAQVAEDDMSTVYKVLFRFASPLFIVSRASEVWRNYYDSGLMQIMDSRANSALLEVRGFETPHPAHCESVAGWAQRVIEMTGKKDAMARHEECRAKGHERCVFELSWRE